MSVSFALRCALLWLIATSAAFVVGAALKAGGHHGPPLAMLEVRPG